MPNPRLAERYAKSLIDLSLERNELETVHSDMLFLQSICESSKDFVKLLRSPIIKGDKKIQVLAMITENKLGPTVTSFNKLLITKEREQLLPEIITSFIQQYKDSKGIFTVRLTTANPLSEELKTAISDKIRNSTSMKNIELNTVVNEDLIGGFVLEANGKMVDASVAYELNNLRKQFQNNDFIYSIR